MSYSPLTLVFATLCGLLTAVMLILAEITRRRLSTHPELRIWVACCLCAAGFTAGMAATSLLAPEQGGALAAPFSLSCAATFCFCLLVFASHYARPRPVLRVLNIIAGLWLLLLIVLFWATPLMIADVAPCSIWLSCPVPGPAMVVYPVFFLSCFVLSITILVRAFRRATGLPRTQLGYILAGFGCAIIGGIDTILPVLTGANSDVLVLPGFLIAMFPGVITYAIVRHRLWDIRTVAHKTAAWLITLSLMVVPLYGLTLLWTRFLPALGPLEQAVLWLGAVLVCSAFVTTVKPRLDHWFERRALDWRRLVDAFANEMVTLHTAEAVANGALRTVAEGLYPEHAAVFIPQETPGTFRMVARPARTIDAPPHPGNAFLAKAVALGGAIESSQLDADPRLVDVRSEARAYFKDRGVTVCMPLVQSTTGLVGLMELGAKRNLKPYSKGDLIFLERLGREVAVGLTNALLFDRVDAQRQNLAELAASLEQRVAERTAQLAEANRCLEAANVRLREIDRSKNRFFANISHDLRTPLTLILLPLEAMLAGELGEFDAEQRGHLVGIQQSALSLLKLIDDLLELSRAEDSRLRLRLHTVPLGALLRRLAAFTLPLAQRKGISLTCAVNQELTAEVDERKLERVIVNLLANALRCTPPEGTVDLGLDVGPLGASISVRDTGVGIPADHLDHVFERFFQLENTPVRQRGSAGIGLALAKELVELHGGTLSVESTEGKGSVFTISLPLNASGLPPERIESSAEPERFVSGRPELHEWTGAIHERPEYRFLDLTQATERRLVPRRSTSDGAVARILAADDNNELLRHLHQLLHDRYEVWTVEDGSRAWELLLQQRHDLVITDLMMPGMSGLELCHRIKHDPRTQHIPVVMLTARDDREHRIEGHAVGADLYLAKPFSAAELRAGIQSLLANTARHIEVAARRRAYSLETLLAGLAHELRNGANQVKQSLAASALLARRLDGKQGSPAEGTGASPRRSSR